MLASEYAEPAAAIMSCQNFKEGNSDGWCGAYSSGQLDLTSLVSIFTHCLAGPLGLPPELEEPKRPPSGYTKVLKPTQVHSRPAAHEAPLLLVLSCIIV